MDKEIWEVFQAFKAASAGIDYVIHNYDRDPVDALEILLEWRNKAIWLMMKMEPILERLGESKFTDIESLVAARQCFREVELEIEGYTD